MSSLTPTTPVIASRRDQVILAVTPVDGRDRGVAAAPRTREAASPHLIGTAGADERRAMCDEKRAGSRQRTTDSGLELVTEVSDLAAGAGIITFTLAPLALPALALTLLLIVPLLVPALIGALVAVPILVLRRLRQPRDRPHGAAQPAGAGGQPARPRPAERSGAHTSWPGRRPSTSIP